jgi:quercetin dioxygenase-like cupin family protein
LLTTAIGTKEQLAALILLNMRLAYSERGDRYLMELKIWNINNMEEIPKAVQEKNFTGEFVMRKLAEESNSEDEIYYVVFKKGCKTRPHVHMSEQTLFVTDGIGTVAFVEKMDLDNSGSNAGLTRKEYGLKKGDIVRIPAGLVHWHGASEDNDFSHVAVRKKTPIETIWL